MPGRDKSEIFTPLPVSTVASCEGWSGILVFWYALFFTINGGKKMKQYEYTWKKWGKQPNQAMRHQEDIECPYCDYHFSKHEYIVGFSNSDYLKRPTVCKINPCAGVVVKECPKCFELCFQHIYQLSLDRVTKTVMTLPDFFKVPGVKEAFLKMTEEVRDRNL